MLYPLTKKEMKAMNDAMEYGCALGLTLLVYIGWFALRVLISICMAFVLCAVCDWLALDVDKIILRTVIIALGSVSILFPTGKSKD